MIKKSELLNFLKTVKKIKVTMECKSCGGHGTSPDHPNQMCILCNGLGEYTQTLSIKNLEIIEYDRNISVS
jgi:DnaJ-class molecular chaperone